MSKKTGINKLMAKRKRQSQGRANGYYARERISYFPSSMTLSDFTSIMSTDTNEIMDKMFGASDEQLTDEQIYSDDVPAEFREVYLERVAQLGPENVWATRKANGDLSIRSLGQD